MARASSKRFAALAIAYAEKYRYDPFFRTEVNVLALQGAFGLIILVIVTVAFSILYEDVTSVLLQGIEESATGDSTVSLIGSSVAKELESLGVKNVGRIVLTISLLTLAIGYIIARVTLSPVRNALSSQKQFIGNVAHELRTPLSTIKTNTEVALMGQNMDRELRQTLESNVEEMDRISEIINNLLSLSASLRPERVAFANVDLGEIVERAVKKLKKLSDKRQLEITMRMGERRVVWGNEVALEQIVSNIVKNAILYTSVKGSIGLTVEATEGSVEMTIQDSGSGIPRSELFHIFEPFYRRDRSRARAGGGSGLGLTIVSELVKLHNGKITIRSAEGKGTTVIVLLPAGMDPSAKEDAHAGRDEIAIDFSDRSAAH